MSTDIVRARKVLELSLADGLSVDQIRTNIKNVLGMMTRKKIAKVTSRKHEHMTPEMAEEIRDYVIEHPGLSQVEVRRVFNVNAGRVSEAVSGIR